MRLALVGTIKVDDAETPLAIRLACGALLACGLGGAAWWFLKAWNVLASVNLRPLLAVALVLHLTAFTALPLTSNDIFSNIAYGREVLRGLNPFHDVPADLESDPIVSYIGSAWRHWQTRYGPLVVDLAAAVAWPQGIYLPVLLFKLALLACTIGAVMVAFRFCRDYPAHGSRSFVLLAWNPLLAWEVSGQAHNDGLLVLALTIFAAAARANRPWQAALALIVGLYSKFVALPVIGLYALATLRRSRKLAAAMAAMMVASGIIFFAPYWRGFETLRPACEASTALPDYLSNSLTALVCEATSLAVPSWRPVAFLAMLLATRLVCLAAAARFALRATSPAQVLNDSLLFLVVYECLGMGWYQPWYAVWLLPLALVCDDIRLQRIVAAYTAIVPALYLPQAGFYVGILIVQLTPLVLLWLTRLPGAARAPMQSNAMELKFFASRQPFVNKP